MRSCFLTKRSSADENVHNFLFKQPLNMHYRPSYLEELHLRTEHRNNKLNGRSIIDVAKAANVSLGTVSRVMNGAATVREDLRRKVLCAARAIGFVPRTLHRHLAVVAGRHNPNHPVGYTQIMGSLIEEFAGTHGVSTEFIELSNLEQTYDCRVGAVIGVVFDDRILQLKEVPNLPVVVINHPLADRGVHSIYTDHKEQGVLATNHLLERGHRKIAFLGNLPDEHGDMARLAGYREALGERGIQIDPNLIRFATASPVYDTLQRWVRAGVTAVLNFGEDAVAEALHVLSNVLGLQIGKDISTITLEDVPLYKYFTPPQTVIRQPLQDLARLAVENALRLIKEGGKKTGAKQGHRNIVDICLHGELISRESVATISELDGIKPSR